MENGQFVQLKLPENYDLVLIMAVVVVGECMLIGRWYTMGKREAIFNQNFMRKFFGFMGLDPNGNLDDSEEPNEELVQDYIDLKKNDDKKNKKDNDDEEVDYDMDEDPKKQLMDKEWYLENITERNVID